MTKSTFDDTQLFTPEGHSTEYQSVSFTGTTATATNAINAHSVLLFATQGCHVRFSNPSSAAVVTDTFIPASIIVPLQITQGNFISVIRNAVSGTLHISPVQ